MVDTAEASSPISTVTLATTMSSQVDAPVLPPGAGVGGAIGNAAHLLQDFVVEAAEEEGVRGGAIVLPVLLVAESGGTALEILWNLAGHQMAMLVSALVGLSFDVEIDPAGGGVAVGGAKCLHGFPSRPVVAGGGFIELNAFEPRPAAKRATIADGEKYLVARAAGDKSQGEVSPRLGAARPKRSERRRAWRPW